MMPGDLCTARARDHAVVFEIDSAFTLGVVIEGELVIFLYDEEQHPHVSFVLTKYGAGWLWRDTLKKVTR